ncbi:DMT family transporter [Parvularcula flava]|uniref:DMT family transporter n=1 Tax=Aquisalinus luteolus TaxID=1566827 RepID=A0A8J3EQ56_9PROT|nr:DMT family transporter [Aquisalinus luteolus]NHK29372.1 DMT family transporter [Aquisalinus luteolus]GGI00978.1 membrane protein [Aquisalinus luteolus]
MPARELIMLVAMCLVWGLHLVVIRATTNQFVDPIFYAACRMTLVAIILSPLLRIHHGQMKRIAIAGLCLGGLNYALMFTGFAHASASVGAMVMELYVPITVLMAVLVLKERIGVPRIAGILIAIAGVGLIALSQESDGDTSMLGVALLVAAMASEATGAIIVKKIEGVKPLELLGWFAIFGSVFLWTATLTLERDQMAVLTGENIWPFLAALSFTVFGASMFGHTTYYWLIQRLPVNQVSSSTLLATVIAVAGGVFILGEPVTWQFIVGGLMTLGGVGVILIRTKDKQGPPSATIAPIEN